MRKIVYLISSLGVGGAERLVVDVANKLDNGWAPYVVLLNRGGQLEKALNGRRVQLLHVNEAEIGFLQTVRSLRAIVSEVQPTIVHSHMTRANIYGRLLAMPRKRFGLINHYHGLSLWKGRMLRLGEAASQSLVDQFIVCSKASARVRVLRESVPKERVRILENAVDVTAYRLERGKRDSWVLGIAGRVTRTKRFDLGIEILAHLRSKQINVNLKVAGDGPELGKLKELSEARNVADQIEFLGHVEYMPEFYRECDALLMTSKQEDSPLVVLEALSSGCYIVDCGVRGGIQEILENAPDSIRVNGGAQDVSEELVEKLFRAGQAGCGSIKNQEYALRYDIQEYVRSLGEIYNSVYERRSTRTG